MREFLFPYHMKPPGFIHGNQPGMLSRCPQCHSGDFELFLQDLFFQKMEEALAISFSLLFGTRRYPADMRQAEGAGLSPPGHPERHRTHKTSMNKKTIGGMLGGNPGQLFPRHIHRWKINAQCTIRLIGIMHQISIFFPIMGYQ